MMQMWHIKDIIAKYGWCEETTKLAIARNVSCCGQAGKEQFNTLVEDGLKDYVADTENRKLFIQNILNEFESWDKLAFRLKEGSKKYYVNYIVSYAKHFQSLLSKNEIEDIETFLMQKWKDNNTN